MKNFQESLSISIGGIIRSLVEEMVEQSSAITKPWGSNRCEYYYLGNNIGLVLIDSNKLLLPTDDFGVSSHIIYGCSWEPWETRLIQELMEPEQTWIEIGANVGYYTINMGNILRQGGQLYSFEASPYLYNLLLHSISMNGLDDVVSLSNRAVWKTSNEKISFVDSDKKYVGGSHIAYGEQDKGSVVVSTITLDKAIKDHSSIDFLKMDVEGAECNILKGASSILENSPNLSIIMEWNSMLQKKAGSNPEECLNYLSSYNLDKMYIIQHDGELEETNIGYLSSTTDHLDILIERSLDTTDYINDI